MRMIDKIGGMGWSRIWLLSLFALPASGTISFQSNNAFLHYNGGLQATFDSLSPEYTSFLDGNNLGSFQFIWLNNTGLTVTDLRFVLFLDADIDRDDNTFFNEYGTFISLALPVGAPPGAIAATEWEIDEPEYVFGNIYSHALAGVLDNSNGVPSSTVDDVSLALLFSLGDIAPGQFVTVTGTLSPTDAAGLGHFDPDSPYEFYFNGHAVTGDGGAAGVPEPSTFAMAFGAISAAACLRRRWTR